MSALFGLVLNRTILVSAVVVTMKLLTDGFYVAAAGLILPLLFFVYLTYTNARLMR